MRAKTVLLFALGVALTLALLLVAGASELPRTLAAASPEWIAAAFAAYAAFFMLRGWRWKLLLTPSAPAVAVRSTTSITAVGWLANSFLPLKGGDILRAALLARRERVQLSTSAAAVGLERVLDLLTLALLAALGLYFLPRAAALPPGIDRALALVWALPLVALAILAALVRWRAATVRVAERAFRPLGRVGARLVEFGRGVLDGLHALASAPALLARVLPLSLAIGVLQALVFTLLVRAFLPATPPILAFAGSTVFLLSFVVSVTPGNLGTYEAAFAAVFIAVGVAPEAAIPAGFLTHIVTTGTVALLGAVGLASLALTRDRHSTAAPQPAPGGPPP